MTVGIALGGGAPNLTLMTGALTALSEAGVDYKVITTTGAGMVAGLIYSAPHRVNGEDWKQARERTLRETREMGIDDLIYDQFPVNYKIFQKPGKLAEAYSHAVNPAIWSIPRDSRRRRLLGDTMGFLAAMSSPSTMSLESQGLCQPPPWIEILVDFDELERNLGPKDEGVAFGLSAYCIEEEEEHFFQKHNMTAEHFKAGLAMPFLYAPYKLTFEDGSTRTYLEGSAIRTMQFNPDGVMDKYDVDTLIYFDLMGHRKLMAEPKHIIDAWGKSIVAPLTQLARNQEKIASMKAFMRRIIDDNVSIIASFNEMTQAIEGILADDEDKDDPAVKRVAAKIATEIAEAREERKATIFEAIQALGYCPPEGTLTTGANNMMMYEEITRHEWNKISFAGEEPYDPRKLQMLRMPFKSHIPEDFWPNVLDWSHSNMRNLWDVGYDTGRCFVHHHMKDLGVEALPAAWDDNPIKFKHQPELDDDRSDTSHLDRKIMDELGLERAG